MSTVGTAVGDARLHRIEKNADGQLVVKCSRKRARSVWLSAWAAPRDIDACTDCIRAGQQ